MFFEPLKKQAENKNEIDSNLSLGTRMTRVKCLSRKRCFDTTPDRCQVVYYFVSHLTLGRTIVRKNPTFFKEKNGPTFRPRVICKMLHVLPNRGVVGSQGLKCTKKFDQHQRLR